VASTRAGNVIGGGDWAADRIIPDCIAALQKDKPILVRNPRATRPWQHVLEPLSGYLWLGASLACAKLRRGDVAPLTSAFNFGPDRESNRTVEELVEAVLRHWPGRWERKPDPGAPHEAGFLQLSTDKAAALLGWLPVWRFSEAVAQTVGWYRQARQFAASREFQKQTQEQIGHYIDAARAAQAAWTLADRAS
jgi:CDP-glucose 4,6-dehydratase